MIDIWLFMENIWLFMVTWWIAGYHMINEGEQLIMGFHDWWVSPIAGWFILWKNPIWTTILGNLHICDYTGIHSF